MSRPPSLAAYLSCRTAAPLSWRSDGKALLIESNEPGVAQLYRIDVDERGDPVQLTALEEPVSGRYAPGSSTIVVAVDAGGNERHQLYRLDDAGGELEPLVCDEEFIHRPGWTSPDGRWLPYGCNRRNGVDFDIYLHDLQGPDGGEGDHLLFSPGGWCFAGDWSPDGRWLAVSRLTERNGDNEMFVVDIESGLAVEVAAHGDGDEAFVGTPAWRRDSKSFYFATDVGRDIAAIARFDLPTGSWEYVHDAGAEVTLAADRAGSRVVVVTNEDGFTRAEVRETDDFSLITDVTLLGSGVADFVWSPDGSALSYFFTSSQVPGDVWLFHVDTKDLQRLTSSTIAVDAASLVEPAVHRFPSFDGEPIPCLLYRGAPLQGTQPVVVWIHGGPESQFRPSWNPLIQYFVARGYAVAAPNVRGSTGYGKRYHHLDDVKKRLDSVADLAALHDWLGTVEGLDPGRAVLMGGSYGGYMVLAGLVFQPERWAAGVDIVGISSLVTFLENTSVWRRAFREREYGSLERDRDFLEDVSPITHLDRLRAPLFLIHGANDPRVPLSEAEQLKAALDARGVPTELLVYADEGHGLTKLKNRLDAYPKAVDFLDRVL